MNSKSRSSIAEIEQPQVKFLCCGSCNLSTTCICFGIFSLIVNLLSLAVDSMKTQSALFYGEYGYIYCHFMGILIAMIFLGVGFTDDPMFSKVARVIQYALVLVYIGLIGWLILALNDEAKFHGTKFEAFHKGNYATIKETIQKNNPEFEFMSFQEHLAMQTKTMIFSFFVGGMVCIYLAGKFGENPEYLQKKAV